MKHRPRPPVLVLASAGLIALAACHQERRVDDVDINNADTIAANLSASAAQLDADTANAVDATAAAELGNAADEANAAGAVPESDAGNAR